MIVTQVEAEDDDSLALNQVSEEEKKRQTVEEQHIVEEIKQEIAQTQRNSIEEEQKAAILENGQINSIHKPVFRRYDVGNGDTFEFGL